MTGSPKPQSIARPKLSDKQVHEFIARVKRDEEELVAEGVHRDDLHKRVSALEAALDKNAPAEQKAKALDDLEAILLTASDGGVSRDVINFFNQLLGTGMPPV